MVTSANKEPEVGEGYALELYEVDPKHPARPMEVVFDTDGNHWLCDKGIDRKGDLATQGCWRCGDFQFTRQD